MSPERYTLGDMMWWAGIAVFAVLVVLHWPVAPVRLLPIAALATVAGVGVGAMLYAIRKLRGG
jgi:hypothetical protein